MDFTQSELDTIQKHVDDRWRDKDHGVHLADIEVDGTERAAAVWEHKHYTFIILKIGAFTYRNLFYFLRKDRFDTGVDEFNDLDECVDSLMKCQADFSLSKSTKNLKPKEDK